MNLIRKILTGISLLTVAMMGVPLAHADQDAQGNYVPPIVITPDTLKCGTFDAFPACAQAAILSGDPRESGYFMLRIKIPAHYEIYKVTKGYPLNWVKQWNK